MKYKIIEFDGRVALERVLLVLVIALGMTALNTLTSRFDWVKVGENFVLFFPVIVGILLYGFATGAVFGAGQAAWSRVVAMARMGDVKDIDEIIAEKPDLFPTFLMFIGWFILVLSSMVIQVPTQMLFLLFFLHVTLMLPLILAMDYWGFTDGIKRIERLK